LRFRPFLLGNAPDPASLKLRDTGEQLFPIKQAHGQGKKELGETLRFRSMVIGNFLDEHFENDLIKPQISGAGKRRRIPRAIAASCMEEKPRPSRGWRNSARPRAGPIGLAMFPPRRWRTSGSSSAKAFWSMSVPSPRISRPACEESGTRRQPHIEQLRSSPLRLGGFTAASKARRATSAGSPFVTPA